MIVLPKCRQCGRKWHPKEGLSAPRDSCEECRIEKRQIAKRTFSLRPVAPDEIDGPYLLPRRMRGRFRVS